MEEKFFTTEQVAKMLQVHPFTILKFIRNGKLKGMKLGRMYRITESNMKEFIESQSTQKPNKLKKELPPTSEETIVPKKEKENNGFYII